MEFKKKIFGIFAMTCIMSLSACNLEINNSETEKQLDMGMEERVESKDNISASTTVLNAQPDALTSQIFYLWEENNAPAITEYTVNDRDYFDDPDFRPYITSYPVPKGTTIKGAVLICAGGAFQFRSDESEGVMIAEELTKLGYQSFVVDYRLSPYTQEEGALDLARAVRFVRKNAKVYGIDEENIAVMGFSAGGILAGEMLLNYDGSINGTVLDKDYKPDALDEVSADAAADGMIYSFYGRLSVASDDVEKFASSDLPPTYFCYGDGDPFVDQFEKCVKALQDADVTVESHELKNMGHGFGPEGDWISDYDRFLQEVFLDNKEQSVTLGSDYYRGFRIDNIYHSNNNGDIHYNVYIPDSYDGKSEYALFITLPGYQGLYFQGVAENIKTEDFGFEAQKYNSKMIILAPQLNDWQETSADQTIALVTYFLKEYNIDKSKVYIEGYSGGGETLSIVLGKRPELFAGALMGSFQWDGDYEPVAKARTPVYFVIGEEDEYYGSEPFKGAYRKLHNLYEQQGVADTEIDRLLVLDVKKSSYFNGTGITYQHGGGYLFCREEKIMKWLFSQEQNK